MSPLFAAEGIQQTLRAHQFLWRICGLLPLPGDGAWYWLYARFMHANSLVFVGCILLSFAEVTSMADCIQVLLLSTTFVLIAIKAYLFRGRYESLCRTIRTMQTFEATTVGRLEERQMLAECGRWCNRMLFLMGFFCYFGCVSISVEPLMNGTKLIYPSMYPFDWLRSRWLYYTTFFYQMINNITLVTFFPTGDVLAPAMYLHLATYARILGSRLERLGRQRLAVGIVSGSDRTRRELVQCVQHHMLCLRLTRELNDIFGVQYAIQFSTSSFIICVAAFQFSLIKPLETPVDCIFLIEYLSAMAAEIFLPCYCGSIVIMHSDDLSRSLYRSEWTTQTDWFKSTMSILMERAKQPMVMYIYRKFCMIHLGAFVNITRFAYTLLAFLKSFQDK